MPKAHANRNAAHKSFLNIRQASFGRRSCGSDGTVFPITSPDINSSNKLVVICLSLAFTSDYYGNVIAPGVYNVCSSYMSIQLPLDCVMLVYMHALHDAQMTPIVII